MAQWDPKNSENDRRVFYEVTGLRLVPEEFQDDHSSDDDVTLNQLLQLQYQTDGIERGGPSNRPGQAYRMAIRANNRKLCSDSGICHSEAGQGSIWG